MAMRRQAAGQESPPSLTAVEAAILAAEDIEEWHREMLLTEVQSLAAFYHTHSQRPASAPVAPT